MDLIDSGSLPVGFTGLTTDSFSRFDSIKMGSRQSAPLSMCKATGGFVHFCKVFVYQSTHRNSTQRGGEDVRTKRKEKKDRYLKIEINKRY